MEQGTMDLPPVEKTWSIGTILAASVSLITAIAAIGSIWWWAATYASEADRVPGLSAKQAIHSTEIAVIQDQQEYNNKQFQEILRELRDINTQLRSINNEVARHGGSRD